MFESLSEKLEGALKDISGQGRINELNIASTMREIRRALLDADVNYQVAREFTDKVKEEALGERVLSSGQPGQQLANFFKSKGSAPLLVAADVYRPAAVDQLKTLASSIRVPVYSIVENGQPVQDAVRVAREAVSEARRTARDIVIIDTAGRLHVD